MTQKIRISIPGLAKILIEKRFIREHTRTMSTLEGVQIAPISAVETQTESPTPWLFNSETAKAAAAISSERRALAQAALDSEGFIGKQLAKVREHLARAHDRLADCLDANPLDPRAVRDVSACLATLLDQEAALSGRPKPGSLRPSAGNTRRQAAGPAEPV